MLPNYSWQLDQLQRVFSWIYVLVYFLAFFGFSLGWRHPKRKLVFGALALGLFSFALCVAGISIAQISFGWRVEGPSLLPLNPIIQFMSIIGLITFVSIKRNYSDEKGQKIIENIDCMYLTLQVLR